MTQPKEILILNKLLETNTFSFCDKLFLANIPNVPTSKNSTKYLSEEHFDSTVADKDKTIENMANRMQEMAKELIQKENDVASVKYELQVFKDFAREIAKANRGIFENLDVPPETKKQIRQSLNISKKF